MIYLLVGLFIPTRSRFVRVVVAMTIAISVEAFRLYHAPALDAFRLTLPGALLLGRIFSAWNIVAYVAGVAFGARIEPNDSNSARNAPIRWSVFVALVFAAAALLSVAFNLDDPMLLPMRTWSRAAVLVLSVAGLASSFALMRWMDHRRPVFVLAALWCFVPLTVGGTLFAAHLREQRILATPPALGQRIGQHFIVGYENVSEIETLVARGLIGGIFVTQRNAVGRTASELSDEIAHLQKLRRDAGLAPLTVASDQEGGVVSRLSPPLPAHSPLSELARLAPDERRTKARQEGERMGEELSTLGVTLDFAPVVDLQINRTAAALDFGSRISQRAIDADPTVVAEVATAFALGLQSKGVKATLKHFPGLGRVAEDTHAVRAHLSTPALDLAASDWAAFREVVEHAPTAVMVSHAIVDAIDPEHPASQSKAAVAGLLRGAWGFDGIVVTDDLVMGAVFRHNICSGVIASLNAGVDLLLVSYDGRQYYRFMDCVLNAVQTGEIDELVLDASEARMRNRLH
jgi:beta-N-acetylhexosaminidase